MHRKCYFYYQKVGELEGEKKTPAYLQNINISWMQLRIQRINKYINKSRNINGTEKDFDSCWGGSAESFKSQATLKQKETTQKWCNGITGCLFGERLPACLPAQKWLHYKPVIVRFCNTGYKTRHFVIWPKAFTMHCFYTQIFLEGNDIASDGGWMFPKPSSLALGAWSISVNNNAVSVWKGQFGGKCLEKFLLPFVTLRCQLSTPLSPPPKKKKWNC